MTLLELVKEFEGFSPVPYLCPAGYWTIGWGHLCRSDHPSIAEAQGEVYLARDLNIAAGAVLRLTRATLAPGQTDALTDFVFNLGAGRYQASTLRAVINRGELDRVPAELMRWVYGGGQKLNGLVRRRAAEIQLWRK